jgi:hypothetical protein
MFGNIVGVRNIQLEAFIHTFIHTYRCPGFINGYGIHAV